LDDDEKLEKIWKSEHSLTELTADKEFKSYDDLKKRLDKVLGASEMPKTTVETFKAAAPKAPKPSEDAPWEPDVSEDDDMAYFSKLADD
jgi:N-glycosylase/DNA lyase